MVCIQLGACPQTVFQSLGLGSCCLLDRNENLLQQQHATIPWFPTGLLPRDNQKTL